MTKTRDILFQEIAFLGKTTNSGINWSFSKIQNPTINYYCHPLQLCFVNQNTAVCTGTLGFLSRTTNSGNSWINYNTSFTIDELYDVEFKDINTGFVIGWSHTYFKTTNAGQSWSKYNLGGSNTGLVGVEYAGANTWYIATYSNHIIYKTTNEGDTWDSSTVNVYQVTDFKFINENTGFGICKYNSFFKTTDGGANWFINNNTGGWNVNFIDENTGFIAGGTMLRKTTNGGITFDIISQSNVRSTWDVEFINRDTIVVSGSTPDGFNYMGATWRSTNGGNNWMICYIPESSPESNLEFTNENTGYFSTSYKTTNGGANWFRIKQPENIMYTNFINSETGYGVGLYGTIAKTTDGGASTFIVDSEIIPSVFSLHQNYPNPFNPSTKIKFDLPQNGKQTIPVKIIIFDILGRQMETILDENLSAGAHEVNWNASRYAAGIYFYMLITDGLKETKKMILVK